MDQQSAMHRYGIMLMAASMAIALFVATQAIAAPAEASASPLPAESPDSLREFIHASWIVRQNH